ncbi:HlyD family efflux transporter periplasmic adaptor subunit [Parahaliea sp. F7430]|uniref:HlyD family efflux transporter periplasmic adaptor subunit n=1 Tax=Sediminihaliea albiluteola TaxID=2758564 RepID=A0A7W2TVY6_9GAMM|nr:HlyD family efflux transporter periplasmic adaptor subunit [Sediminihaliea albiluteola]MBA6412844.1 HlyD family efflux transporter periplasmic adaptor subunit [Sediminihaliea albiluteola]
MSLFRAQAVAEAAKPGSGEALLSPKLSHSAACAALFVWLAACAYLLSSTNYARKETVTGWLEPIGGVIRVYATREGKLTKLFVSEGELVEAGQALLLINGDRILSSGEHLETLLLEEYEAQKDVLTRRLGRSRKIALERQNKLNQESQAIRDSLGRLREQESTISQQQAIVDIQIQRHDKLAQAGHVASTKLEVLKERALNLKLQDLSLAQKREEQLLKLQSNAVEKKLLAEESQDGLDAISYSLSEISQKIAELHGHQAYVLKASRAGRVSNIQISEGQQALKNMPLMTLTPENEQLQVQLIVPVAASGFISQGQKLSFRFDAFPYQKFGTYEGKIESISAAVLLPSEIHHPKTAISAPAYKVYASLASNSVSAYGKLVPLRPGMTLAADITLEQRSVFEWLLEPLLSLRGRL